MTYTNRHIRMSVLIDIRKTDLSLYEMLSRIDQYKANPAYQDSEIYLDGSLNAIVAKEVA